MGIRVTDRCAAAVSPVGGLAALTVPRVASVVGICSSRGERVLSMRVVLAKLMQDQIGHYRNL